MTKLSLTRAAVEFGVSKETVRRRLSAIGVKTGTGQTFTIKTIHAALAGDLRFEQTRIRRAQAERAERQNKIEEGVLVNAAEVEAELLPVMRQTALKMRALPQKLCTIESERVLLEQEIEKIFADEIKGTKETFHENETPKS